MLNKDSRIKNSVRNAGFSVVCQAITLICTFITRTVFIRCLGSSYLGISGLFTNILSVLSIVDLGFDTAIVYSMYKPIAEKNEKKISALMNFFKKIYMFVGIGVGIIGICLVPFLKYLVNLSTPIDHITIYYLLYLLNTVLSYLLANRVAIINADQKMYVIKQYTLVFKIIQSIVQIISLVCFKNFMLYLIIEISVTFLTNLYGAFKAKRMYPFLKNSNEKIDKKEQKNIFENVKSMFIYKIGGVILNNTDNILISIMATTELVGYYGNYTTIITSVTNLVSLVFSSMLASVGNLNAEANEKKREETLYKIDFMATWIYGFCGICIMVLCNGFISLMWGEQYAINLLVPLAAVINFIIIGFLHPLRLYRETTGVFKEVKYIFIWTSILNLILSIILGNLFTDPTMKLFGIIIATAIARILTTVWFEPKKIFNVVFKESSKKYFIRKAKDVCILLINFIVVWEICSFIQDITWIALISKAIVCTFAANILYLLFYFRTKEFKYFWNLFVGYLNKFLKRKVA